mgnify:CR=1 FL=1
MTGDNGFGDFLAFCVEVTQFISNPQVGQVTDLFTGATFDAIDKLFSNAFAGEALETAVDTSVKAAGFQMALWEVVYDTGAGGYDLSNGTFQGSASGSVVAQANAYLAGIGNGAMGAYDITFLASELNQDLVTVTPVPVPLPATALLRLGGLGGSAALRRKKAS